MFENLDFAPLSMFARLRTISAIIGMPPRNATTVLATPTASKSRFRSVLRLSGSSVSTAFELSSDSRLPMIANSAIHFHAKTCFKIEKSGKTTIRVRSSARVPSVCTASSGTFTRCFLAASVKLPPNAEYV